MSDDVLLDVLAAGTQSMLFELLPENVTDPIIEHAETRDELNKALRKLDVERSLDEEQPVFACRTPAT